MTQMDEAKRGNITKEMRIVAKNEGIDPEYIRTKVKKGRVVIPKNINHEFDGVRAIGEGLSIKVNVNLGTSMDWIHPEEELKKLRIAVKYGADAVMDLSTGGDLPTIRKKIIESSPIPVGTVPIYQAGIYTAKKPGKAVVDMTEDDMFNTIEAHGKDGVDFITVHTGVTKETVEKLRNRERTTGMVSRGGSFLLAWILHNGKENPLYQNFDYLLEIAKEYDMTLSLGDGLRPGGIADSTDIPQIGELLTLGELVKRAREYGVQVMVEGPGHIIINEIGANVILEKSVTRGAPFYVLGPLVTDIFPGYDHIVGAIGGALAAMAGADFLCYLTPAEHLALPTLEDVKEGLIASKIAAHAVDITRGKGIERDLAMDRARGKLDWKEQFSLCFDPEKARAYRKRRGPSVEEVCSMCGEFCALKMANSYLKGEK
ncbi:MAG: phosphomethylpyrimidine synthase ThiC [Candidatus Heimdallarchaeaceae archaeon]